MSAGLLMAHVGQHRPQSVARACRQAAPAAEEGFPNAADLAKYTETPPWHKEFAAPSRARSPVCWCSHLSPVQTHLEHIMFVMPRQVLPAEVLRNHTVINSSLTCPPPIAKCSVSPRRGRVLCHQPLVPSPPLERRRDNSGDVTNGSEKPSAT